jgi:mycothiol synthase
MKPPAPFSDRPATLDDAQAVADLLCVYEAAHSGDPEQVSGADVRDWWRMFDLERDSLLMHAPGGQLAALALTRVRLDRVIADSYVHPDFKGRGLGTFLLDHAEARVPQLGLERLRVFALAEDPEARELLERRGYRTIRSFYRMLIDLHEPPSPPKWPDGISVSSFRPGDERTYYEVHEESFEDHWEHESRTFEEWCRRTLESESFDPDLVFLARADDEPAGVAFCSIKFGRGWIDVLGVRRAWRGRGIGAALLRQGFAALHERGEHEVALGVDAESPTGATRLYEREGMRVASQADLWEKRLSPGS